MGGLQAPHRRAKIPATKRSLVILNEHFVQSSATFFWLVSVAGRFALPAQSALTLPCARAPHRGEIIRGRKRSLVNLNEHFAQSSATFFWLVSVASAA